MFSCATILRRTPAVLLTGAAVAIMAGGWIGARSWLVSHDNAVQLAATLSAQKQLLGQATSRQQQRDAALAKTLTGIAAAKRKTQTPAEIVAQLPQLLPALPDPILLTLPAPTAAQPTPDAAASIPQADLKPLYDYVQDCRACQAKLSTVQGDLADERTKEAALATERDAAVKAAKGGTLWLRMETRSQMVGHRSRHRRRSYCSYPPLVPANSPLSGKSTAPRPPLWNWKGVSADISGVVCRAGHADARYALDTLECRGHGG